ncbi:MAG: hypothetical protein PHR77_02590 [Kiritimatiellae bacterium]|nr:hypothetical protein [Kiritimatiellia bacterium]
MPVFRLQIVSALLWFCCFQFTASATSNIISRPVGFVRITISTNEQRLVSLPFRPFDASINKVLAGQLTGSTKEKSSDRVLKWDAVVAKYVQALKADGNGNAEIDGKWFSDLKKLVPSDMTLEPGEGFFIWNRQASTQDVFLAGEVVLDATNSMVLMPSLNLVGYPYSASKGGSSAPSPDISGSPILPLSDSLFEMGKGYWYNNTSSVATVWIETRPYADVFPAEGGKPVIAGIQTGNGKEAILTIECEGVSGERLDIYYQDLMTPDCIDRGKDYVTPKRWVEGGEGGWLIADIDIPVNGKTIVEWTDSGTVASALRADSLVSDRKSVNEIFARYYLVGRADIDMDKDGVPDARQKFVLGRNLSVESGTVASALRSDASLVSTNLSSVSSNLVSGSRHLPLAISSFRCRIIYVDKNSGADHLKGRSAVVAGSDGPKKTIRAGLEEAGSEGNTLIIKSGTYGENLNIAGKNISVRIEGNVDLRGNRQVENKTPVIVTPPVETNFMNSVTNR